MTPTTFEAMPLAAPLHRVLRELEYHTPSPIQAQAIPLLLEGRDLLGCAQTGTGKTAGFALPILNALHENPRPSKPKSARTLVLAPTRELAVQVAKSFATYGKHVRFRQTMIYGGVGQNPQVAAMRGGVDVLVATPGRLLDLIEQRHVDLSGVEFFVLDEVDRMLDMGFLRDVKKIVSMIPAKRQSLFFSATLAPNIVQLAETILRNPAHVSIQPETTTAERIEQKVCFVTKDGKRPLLEQLLAEQSEPPAKPSSRSCSAAPSTARTSSPRASAPPASRPTRSTATSRRLSARRRSTASARASRPSSSPPTSPPAASM